MGLFSKKTTPGDATKEQLKREKREDQERQRQKKTERQSPKDSPGPKYRVYETFKKEEGQEKWTGKEEGTKSTPNGEYYETPEPETAEERGQDRQERYKGRKETLFSEYGKKTGNRIFKAEEQSRREEEELKSAGSAPRERTEYRKVPTGEFSPDGKPRYAYIPYTVMETNAEALTRVRKSRTEANQAKREEFKSKPWVQLTTAVGTGAGQLAGSAAKSVTQGLQNAATPKNTAKLFGNNRGASNLMPNMGNANSPLYQSRKPGMDLSAMRQKLPGQNALNPAMGIPGMQRLVMPGSIGRSSTPGITVSTSNDPSYRLRNAKGPRRYALAPSKAQLTMGARALSGVGRTRVPKAGV